MAVSSAQVTVGTSATLLSAADGDSIAGQSLYVSNAGPTAVVLGPSGVTATTGFTIASGVNFGPIELGTGEALYGIVASGTQAVGVLRTGV